MYEYAVIRVVPRVEREEFINVGIILFSKRKKFLRAKYMLHEAKLKMLFPEIDIGVIRENLIRFVRVPVTGDRSPGWISRNVFAGLRPSAARLSKPRARIPVY